MLSFDLLWHMNLWRIIRMLLQLSPILKLFIADVAPEQKKLLSIITPRKKKWTLSIVLCLFVLLFLFFFISYFFNV